MRIEHPNALFLRRTNGMRKTLMPFFEKPVELCPCFFKSIVQSTWCFTSNNKIF